MLTKLSVVPFRVHTVAELKALCASAEEFRREARDLLGLEVE